jgi:hypothetical protein
VRNSADIFDADRVQDCRVVYAGIRTGRGADVPEGVPRQVKIVQGVVPEDWVYLDLGVFAAGKVVWGLLDHYGEPWHFNLRGGE